MIFPTFEVFPSALTVQDALFLFYDALLVRFHTLVPNQDLKLKLNSDFVDLTTHFRLHFQISLFLLTAEFDPPSATIDYFPTTLLSKVIPWLHVFSLQSLTLPPAFCLTLLIVLANPVLMVALLLEVCWFTILKQDFPILFTHKPSCLQLVRQNI